MCEYSILYLINPRQVVVIHKHSGLAKMIGSLFEHGKIMVIHEYSKFKFDLVFSRYFKMCSACWKGIRKTRVIPGYSNLQANLLYRIVFGIWKPTVIRGYLKYKIRTVSHIDFPKVIHEHFRDSFPLCDFVYLFIHLFCVLLNAFSAKLIVFAIRNSETPWWFMGIPNF